MPSDHFNVESTTSVTWRWFAEFPATGVVLYATGMVPCATGVILMPQTAEGPTSWLHLQAGTVEVKIVPVLGLHRSN